MTIIEARYVGPFKIEEWGEWHLWQRYSMRFYAEKALPVLKQQFFGLYEFRMITT